MSSLLSHQDDHSPRLCTQWCLWTPPSWSWYHAGCWKALETGNQTGKEEEGGGGCRWDAFDCHVYISQRIPRHSAFVSCSMWKEDKLHHMHNIRMPHQTLWAFHLSRPVKSHALRVWHTQSAPFTCSHANQDYSHAFLFMPGTGIWPAVLQVSEIVECGSTSVTVHAPLVYRAPNCVW